MELRGCRRGLTRQSEFRPLMKQLHPDLWQTRAEHPFGPGSATHAYLLIRSSGNVLFYNCGHSDEYPDILRLGGAVRQYLSHRDEAGAALWRIKESLGSLLCCHALEAAAVRKTCPVDLTFENRECHLGDIEVIPTPGHTDGSTCFLCTSQHRKLRYLFTGDTIFPDGDSWGIVRVRKAQAHVGRKPRIAAGSGTGRGAVERIVGTGRISGNVARRMAGSSGWRYPGAVGLT